MENYERIEDLLAEYHQETVNLKDVLEIADLFLTAVIFKENKNNRVAVFIGEEMVWDELTDLTSAKDALMNYIRYTSFRRIPMGIKKLSEFDVQCLRNLGYHEEDLPYIDNAIGKTKYVLCVDGKNKRISAKKAREILGDESFVSGVGRSTFHQTASRETESGIMVAFMRN